MPGSEAESLFGIDADVAAVGHVPTPDGWLEHGCSTVQAQLVYGGYPGAVAPALVPGKALGWDGTAWQLVDPKPRNSNGAVGTLGTCPGALADSAAPDAASTDAATDAHTEYPPCAAGSGGSSNGGSSNGGSGGGGDGAIGGSSDAAQDGSTVDGSGGTAPSDAGTGDGAESSGCACASARTPGASDPLAGVALLLLATLRVRSSRTARRPGWSARLRMQCKWR